MEGRGRGGREGRGEEGGRGGEREEIERRGVEEANCEPI